MKFIKQVSGVACRRESQHATNALIALGEIVDGRVYWKARGAYRVGLVRWDSPCGGLAVVQYRCKGQRNSYSVFAVDDLCEQYGPRAAALSGDKEMHELAQLVTDVRIIRDELAAKSEGK